MKARTKAHFYCGTSNVTLPVPNKDHFPPEYRDKTRLQYYASIFNTVEINSSFYKIPRPQTVKKWTNEVPASFRFSFKLWKGITHNPGLTYEPADIERFLQAIHTASKKKGCLLIQFPASVKVSLLNRLRKLLDDLHSTEEISGWRLALEFRDKSWYDDTVYEVLEQYKAGVVVHDMPKSATPTIDMESSFMYLRFHGEKGDYRGSYTDEFLEDYATQIKAWQREGKTVFAYFNNTMGQAVHNAMELKGHGK